MAAVCGCSSSAPLHDDDIKFVGGGEVDDDHHLSDSRSRGKVDENQVKVDRRLSSFT